MAEHKPIKFKLGELIKQKEREDDRKYTLKYISDKSGINKTTLSLMSRNKGKVVSLETLGKLCEFFDCNVEDLLIRE